MERSGSGMTGAADHSRILAAARNWAGAPMAIATVIQTWRSAPCPVGTHMLVHADGRFAGSVSGGCVEGDVLAIAAQVIAGGVHKIRRYGVANDAAWEVGLPCGGDIVVLVQLVSATGFAPELFTAIGNTRASGQTLSIVTDLNNGQSAVPQNPPPLGQVAQRAGGGKLPTMPPPGRLSASVLPQGERILVDASDQFINLYHPQRRLLIVGAVDIAVALANIAAQLDTDVTVIDPRARFLTAERFPGITCDDRWPDEAIAALRPDHRTAVVTLSHDIKIDDPALIAALATPAAYIGALGSKASHAARLQRLRGEGIGEDDLRRIEGPAGVTVNAISASEIALSIAGGMIRAFNNGLR